MSEISLYDIVKLTVDVPGFGIGAGSMGTVIDKLAGDAWLVEFDDIEDATGFPVALGFCPDKLSLVKAFSSMTSAPSLKTDEFATTALLRKD